jgi:hypothetical protein
MNFTKRKREGAIHELHLLAFNKFSINMVAAQSAVTT